ncbi:hypothetical protein FRC11_009286 [Ceratobasidium sp. 423]|nr:hypothetical protein FRC11_009286 [Ceratobasidium sp. 423]
MLTQREPTLTPSAIFQRWENASNQLIQSFSAYLDSCKALDACSATDFKNTGELVSRIDDRLGPMRALLELQLVQSHASVAHMRNKLKSRLCCFPDEIMTSIFRHFIQDFGPDFEFSGLPMKQQIRAYYRRLGIIGEVCSFWREIVISDRSLWSLIPIIFCISGSGIARGLGKPYGLIQTLVSTRTQGGKLHIAVHLPDSYYDRIPDLSQYSSRIYSVNIVAYDHDDIHVIAKNLLKGGELHSLSELSVYHTREYDRSNESSGKCTRLYELILKSSNILKVLRIGGFDLDFKDLQFSHLAELRVQDITLGSTPGARDLLAAIASAPSLRILWIISVETLYPPAGDIDYTIKYSTDNPISLPNLEVLHLEKMYLGLTNVLLHSIVPGPNCLINLHATAIIFHPMRGNERVQSYHDIFRDVNIRRLYLVKSGHWIDSQPTDVLRLLQSMNRLEELHLNSWRKWSALVPQPTMSDSDPPTFKRLCITNGQFSDPSEIKKVITSCSPHHLTLGGSIIHCPIRETDEIIAWLESTIPQFSLIPPNKHVAELKASFWWL